jgi:hypothetical protein
MHAPFKMHRTCYEIYDGKITCIACLECGFGDKDGGKELKDCFHTFKKEGLK